MGGYTLELTKLEAQLIADLVVWRKESGEYYGRKEHYIKRLRSVEEKVLNVIYK